MNLSLTTLWSSAALVVASAAAFSALAQTPPPPAPAPVSPAPSGARAAGKGFKALDANHDNMISREEARMRPRLIKNFDAIDTSKDGQLSRGELKAYRQAHKGEGNGKS